MKASIEALGTSEGWERWRDQSACAVAIDEAIDLALELLRYSFKQLLLS
jgi:hypothetical protein